MDAFYQDKDVFVNFSVTEGGPLTLFESLSHGLVPVVTDAGCARRFIREGENGYLIDSPEAAVETLKGLAGNLASLQGLGGKGLGGVRLPAGGYGGPGPPVAGRIRAYSVRERGLWRKNQKGGRPWSG